MVHLETLNRLKGIYNSQLKELVKEHPGEYVLIEDNDKISFFSDEADLNSATEKYRSLLGPTLLVTKIPTHLIPEGEPQIFQTSKYIKNCPYSQKTILPLGPVTITGNNMGEYTKCSECGLSVFRKPSPETIKRIREDMKKPIGASLSLENKF